MEGGALLSALSHRRPAHHDAPHFLVLVPRYRETALLASANTSSAAELQRVAVVVSHELA